MFASMLLNETRTGNHEYVNRHYVTFAVNSISQSQKIY